MKNNAGLTLVEISFTLAILSIVLGTLFAFSLSIADTTRVSDVRATNVDEARRFFQMSTPMLRQAAGQTVSWPSLPGDEVSFQCAEDLDGNGSAVDVAGEIELGAQRTIRRDIGDINDDGFAEDQLIMVQEDEVLVLANNVSLANEIGQADGSLLPANDTNENGRLDRGFWVEPENGGVRLYIQTEGTSRQGHVIATAMSELVLMRN